MINLVDLRKTYGRSVGLDHITLDLPDTGIYCLLGRNGAGKTTLMKLIAGHIGASGGEVRVNGQVVVPGHMPTTVNYVEANLNQFNMSVSSLIKAAASVQHDFDMDFASTMIDRFRLPRAKKYKHLSFGMRTMVTAIITLANNSPVILMDEPTLGFDAIMREQFNALLLESYAAHPRLIVVSTHLIDEIAKVAEHLVIIDQGKVLVHASVADLDERAYTLSGMADAVRPLLVGLNCIGTTMAGSAMAAHIWDHRITPPIGVSVSRLSLQDFFIALVGGNNNA
ncbi:MAG: ABC transporter ATP-binding protein [Propionibacteriaceae bacterium]|jgi:ABC-2 type transport system ATP-binding protein|nr:ABC transporter ATP-binding protein [Propionibacteriaceae bacterium]